MAQRMAGDEISKYGSLGDRFGEDYVDRVKSDGRQDGNKYSRKELASEFRYGRGDTSLDDTIAKYQGMVDDGKFKGNNKAQGFLEMHGVEFGGGGGSDDSGPPETSPEDPESTLPMPGKPPKNNPYVPPAPINIYPNPGGTTNTQTQIVNQDNDQTSTVNGDGNTVTQNQDNSVSQSGFNAGLSAKAQGMKNKYVLNLLGA